MCSRHDLTQKSATTVPVRNNRCRGDTQTGNSVNADRAVYMANSGQLYFGVSAGAVRTINSALSYNDGFVHHVVATLSSAGMFLDVDGSQVASDPTTTTAQNYTGYWRVGEDNLAGWPSAPTSNFFNGIIDDVAVYPSALSLQRAQVHYCEGANANCLSITQPTSVTFPGQGLDGTDHTISAAYPYTLPAGATRRWSRRPPLQSPPTRTPTSIRRRGPSPWRAARERTAGVSEARRLSRGPGGGNASRWAG